MPQLISTLNFDYGYIENKIIGYENEAAYSLWRQQFGTSEAINIAVLNSENNYTYRDIYIEQGIKYFYLFSNIDATKEEVFEIEDKNSVQADFEDIFLSDATKSLRIRFNPKVSTFKTIFQEQKIDTIGGRYPIFVRNGNLKYRELALSGLISSDMDDFFSNNLISFENQTRGATPGEKNNLTLLNSRDKFYNERKFKLEVEAWLTNGWPKLFRSPQEGNYIIRLMNVSLSPMEQLSRLLHTFSATGYELDSCTYDNLKKWEILYSGGPSINIVTDIATNTTYGIVKGSVLENHISVNADGTMQVSSLNLAKLSQTEGDYLLLGDVD